MNAMPIFEAKKEDGEFSTFPSPPEVAIWREGSLDVVAGRVEVSWTSSCGLGRSRSRKMAFENRGSKVEKWKEIVSSRLEFDLRRRRSSDAAAARRGCSRWRVPWRVGDVVDATS